MPFTQSREVGQRAGPASVEWHNYRPMGTGTPAAEMARIVLVQSQLEDVKNFDDERTQKTLMQEASQVTFRYVGFIGFLCYTHKLTRLSFFRSILQPTVMDKYQQSLRGDKAAMSVLKSMSQVGTMDDEQLGKVSLSKFSSHFSRLITLIFRKWINC